MLFNSFSFLFAFLPLTIAGFFLLARRGSVAATAWLAAASLFFYGWWDARYIFLLLASITCNYCCARQIVRARRSSAKRNWLTLAIAANLLLLGYYKYANFFIASAAALGAHSYPALDIVLPIGISFFTFTQIAFLVDTSKGKVDDCRFLHYVLFVTYFPHLIAGPVLHHKEMMPQFDQARQLSCADIAVGLSIFCFGLAKKVLLADKLAPYASNVFDGGGGDAPTLLLAWGGVLAYAFQLYFDFSGYSDMAIGLSRLFGIHLPMNFDSPYKATNISQFWRRWHMTLSRFLRDYLYIAIGGNRCGPLRRQINLMLTMVLGGLWHGAGWNFAIWGALHGLFLVIHQGWTVSAKRLGLGLATDAMAWKLAATLLTFLLVCCAWVFFRAADLATSIRILQGMGGGFGVSLPHVIGDQLGNLKPVLENAGVHFVLGGGQYFIYNWCWVALAALITFTLPNTMQIVHGQQPQSDNCLAKPAIEPTMQCVMQPGTLPLQWAPSPLWAVALGLLATAGLLSLSNPSQFLYFQF